MSKLQTAESECKDCHARILWAKNQSANSNGKKVPLDAEPNPEEGTWALDEQEMTSFRIPTEMIERARRRGSRLYTNHRATCTVRPAASEAATEQLPVTGELFQE